MEQIYKLTDPKAILKDLSSIGNVSRHCLLEKGTLGSLGRESFACDVFNGQTTIKSETSSKGNGNAGRGLHCHICQDPGHLANRCPNYNKNNMSSEASVQSSNSSFWRMELLLSCGFNKSSAYLWERAEVFALNASVEQLVKKDLISCITGPRIKLMVLDKNILFQALLNLHHLQIYLTIC